MPEEPFAVYDEDEIPGNKASEMLESPEDAEESSDDICIAIEREVD